MRAASGSLTVDADENSEGSTLLAFPPSGHDPGVETTTDGRYGIAGPLIVIGFGVAIDGVTPGNVTMTLELASPVPLCVL